MFSDLLNGVTARPGRVLAGVVLLPCAVAAAVWAAHGSPAHPASSSPGATAAASVAASGRDGVAVDALTAFAARLRQGPTTVADVPAGVKAHYLPDVNTVRGTFTAVGKSGTCYLVSFEAGPAWVRTGDVRALKVGGPEPAETAACS